MGRGQAPPRREREIHLSGVSVHQKDHGFKKLQKSLETLKDAEIRIGIQGPEATQMSDKGVTVVEYATFHEFGLGVPRRSFLADWMTEQQAEIQQTVRAVVKSVTQGKYDAETGLERAGARFVGLVQARIATNIPPPLAASTVAAKGSSVALIDTGLLRSSITYVVKLGGEE